MQKTKGSLTVFAALSFMLIAQMLFTLAEGVRVSEMRKIAEMNTDSVLESVFAEYCRPLMENYHLLAYDMGNDGSVDVELPESLIYAETAANFAVEETSLVSSETNLLRLSMADVSVDSYTLLTDGRGSAYVKSVSSYMKRNLLYEAAKQIYNNYESVQSLMKNGKTNQGSIEDAISSLKNSSGNLPTAQTSPAADSGTDSAGTGSADTSFLEEIQRLQKKGILSLVVSDGTEISDSSITLSGTVSHRSLSTGKSSQGGSAGDWYDTVLLQQYLTAYLGNFQDPSEDGALSYELEYVIGGKSSDQANLKATAEKLLAVREVANMVYLYGSAARQEELTVLATTIAGVSGNPVVIALVKAALAAAWAFCESILDIRALLHGDKIALLKSDTTWTSTLGNIPSLLKGGSRAKDCSQGIDYEGYLGILILMNTSGKNAMRAMDVQELAIRKIENYSSFRMDHAVCTMGVTAEYTWNPLFLSFVTLLSGNAGGFTASEASTYSYWSSE